MTAQVNLYNHIILDEFKDQAESLLADIYRGIGNVRVQQQPNGSDCGIFAIAFATSLVYALKPENGNFDIIKMRQHHNCLQNDEITSFSTL